jgi:Ricin-type beta-trefoil lectin domain
MMRGRIRRLVVCGAVAGLLAAGAAGASMELAHADTPVTSCDGFQNATATQYECTVATGTATSISDPSLITVGVTDDTSGYTETVVIDYTVTCTDTANGELTTTSKPSEQTPVSLNLSLPESSDGSCTVSATITSPINSTTADPACPVPSGTSAPSPSPSPTASTCADDFSATLSYTPSTTATASATATSTSTVDASKGYYGKCLDDKGNSSANGAAVVIWSCSGTDQAENWKWTSNEFQHNGKCLNDKGDGGSGSKLILYTCNGGSNEKWSHMSDGELKLKAHNGTLCMDDPAYSTKNGTQLIVYKCKASSNQKWSLP